MNAGLADTVDAVDTVDTKSTKTAVSEEPEAASPKAKKTKPEARGEPLEPDPLLFSMLLRTQRLLERDAHAAKLSNLRIV